MSKKELAHPKPTVIRKSWNGSSNYDEITVVVNGQTLATCIAYKHGSDVAKFVAIIEEALSK